MHECPLEFAVQLSRCCGDQVGFLSVGKGVVSFVILAARDSEGKCSGVPLGMVMVFLFEEKQLSCLHNKWWSHGMRYICVVCEQCGLASPLSPRKLALVSGFYSSTFSVAWWILYFCVCCNLCSTQIGLHIPVSSNTTKQWHNTNSSVPEIKKWVKRRTHGSQTGHPWVKQRWGPSQELCSGACFSHPDSALNVE